MLWYVSTGTVSCREAKASHKFLLDPLLIKPTMFATSAAVKALARREVARVGNVRTLASLEAYEDFGKMVFTGKVADEYLKKHGGSGEILKDPSWVKDHSDVVANAVFDW
jgi:glutamine synthetase